tara:strand:+ start:5288 stop:5788 length:501 start_codon:yes stop_codon:yes gene_type:complete
MKHFSVFLGIFVALAASRFVPHPPNFTSLIALSFYVPAILGLRHLPSVIISFAITDLIIGYHFGTHWTWGSVLLIGLISIYFRSNIKMRMTGAFIGAVIFYIVTNFGVWMSGMYPNTLQGLYTCYFLAIPFFGYTLLSTFIFSGIIEIIYKITTDRIKSFSKIVLK